MVWDVEYTDEFEAWWVDELDNAERESVAAYVALLEERGPALEYPYSSAIRGSRYAHLRELRIQHKGRPYRVLYAFDPRRTAILLIGGAKKGDDRWYEVNVPLAKKLYAAHLEQLMEEGLIDGKEVS
jgi:hypothetical protein